MNDNNDYHPLPQPDELTEREKEDAMGGYLMMFAAVGAGLPLPIINLIAAIIYYYINKAKSRFVHFHALQSLISQIPVSLINAAAVIWGIRVVLYDAPFDAMFKGYLVMLVVANLTYFIFSIVGAVKARKGYFYYFIFFGRFSYETVYRIKPVEEVDTVNRPPN